MTYRGHVENGVVILDEPAELPEGTEVEIAAVEAPVKDNTEKQIPTLAEQFKSWIGIANDLPSDSAANHDHYLYGTPRK
ncbi:MAG: hypothetical protein GHCLOJNM_03532 [bacterium]|nr:hypothetical protein [bacterium]